jgi:hypothetical protein
MRETEGPRMPQDERGRGEASVDRGGIWLLLPGGRRVPLTQEFCDIVQEAAVEIAADMIYRQDWGADDN